MRLAQGKTDCLDLKPLRSAKYLGFRVIFQPLFLASYALWTRKNRESEVLVGGDQESVWGGRGECYFAVIEELSLTIKRKSN